MKIQTKLTLLLFLLIAVSMIGFLYLRYLENNRADVLFRDQEQEKAVFFDKIVNLKGASLQAFATDYTFFDEMVRFVSTGDRKWGVENISTGMETFHANIAWVYNPKFSLVYSTNNIKTDTLKEIPLPKGAYNKLFANSHFCHFFINISLGVMEIRGATIHPTFDYERKTPIKGYFFIGRLWTDDYINELSRLTESTIKILPVGHEEMQESNHREKGIITFSRILAGWDGSPLMRVHVRSESTIIKELNRLSKNQFILSIIFASVVLIFLSVFLMRWVNIPLKLISKSLDTEEPTVIKRLQDEKTEFGRFARLLLKFFEQRLELIKEITERKRAEEKLSEYSEHLEDLVKERTTELKATNEQLQKEITERKRTEETLREINAQLNTLIEAIPDAVYFRDAQNRYLLVNKAVEEMVGLRKEEIIGKTMDQLLPQDLLEQCRRSNNEAIKHKLICIEEQMTDKNGKNIFFETIKIPLLDDIGNIRGLVGISRNITERKLAEEKLLSYQEQLRFLASELSLVEERERRQIATSLHDNIGQTLALSYIKLGALQETASSPSLAKSFKEIRELIEQAILYTKTLTSDISPPILYELGFEAAVEWLGEQIQNQYGILFNFEDDKQPKPLNDEIRIILFQAVRELFINITKHAQARNAKVFVQREGNEIRINVEDDGVGFDISQINSHLGKSGSFGLFNIRERLNYIGGKLKIDSKIGNGTRISLQAPLKSEEKNCNE